MLGFRSVNGTSTVILTRLGLNCSTVLGTLLTPGVMRIEGRRRSSVRKPRQSYGDAQVDPKPLPQPPEGEAGIGPERDVGRRRAGALHSTIGRLANRADQGRSVVARASVFGAEDRRFEYCRPYQRSP